MFQHHVALPPGQQPTAEQLAVGNNEAPAQPTAGREPARVFPFPLDGFQRAATVCIDRSESVLVSAHTSAGKTVCAEYAIATALRDGQRVIYSSPI